MLKFLTSLFEKKKKALPVLIKKKVKKPQTPQQKFLSERYYERVPIGTYLLKRVYEVEHKNSFYKSVNVFFDDVYYSNKIFFINKENNPKYKEYLIDNQNEITLQLKEKGRNFMGNIDSKTPLFTEEIINYYFPHYDTLFLKNFIEEESEIIQSENKFDTILLEYIGFSEKAKTGFLTFFDGNCVFVGKNDDESIAKFIEKYIANIKENVGEICFSIGEKDDKLPDEPSIELDDETQEIVANIKEQIEKLKESGQVFLIAPILEKLYKSIPVKSSLISPIVINEVYEISLPTYNNLKIQLGHLTKAIYFLFLRHLEGINLTELYLYKEELLYLYKHISYRIDLEQIEQSVENIVAPQSKAIYQHLSRIKSAFTSKFVDSYAQNYYIRGAKNAPKSISLTENLIHWECDF